MKGSRKPAEKLQTCHCALTMCSCFRGSALQRSSKTASFSAARGLGERESIYSVLKVALLHKRRYMVSDAVRRRCEDEKDAYFTCSLSIWALMYGKDQTRADYNALIDKHELRFNSIPITYDKCRKPSEFPTYETQRNRRFGTDLQSETIEAQDDVCSSCLSESDCTVTYKPTVQIGHTSECRLRLSSKYQALERRDSCKWFPPFQVMHWSGKESICHVRNMHELQKEGCSHTNLQKQEHVGGHIRHVWYLEASYLENKENNLIRQRQQYRHEGNFEIYVEDILLGIDRRTTCMIKNIPNKYSLKMLIELLDEDHRGTYNFVYLRMDFKNKCNVGYAFVNFANCMSIVSFYKKVHGKTWKRFTSNKICELTYASIQGFSKLVNKFRNSSVMQEKDSFRPKIFHTRGPQKGLERKLL